MRSLPPVFVLCLVWGRCDAGEPLTNDNINTAASQWTQDRVAANKTSGPRADWDVSKVTSLASTFAYADKFNGDLSKWDVSSVTECTGRPYRGACPLHAKYAWVVLGLAATAPLLLLVASWLGYHAALPRTHRERGARSCKSRSETNSGRAHWIAWGMPGRSV